MTTLLVDRGQLDEITRQAREVHPARTLLTWVASLLFGIGWVAFKVFVVIRKVLAVLWLAGAWMFVATRTGWRQAKADHGSSRPG